MTHGCQAGLQQEACDKVYCDRIQRREAYSTKKLGAFGSDLGAVACFFETPWRRVSLALTDPAQAWLLNEAACSLRALGRLSEALDPMRAALKMAAKAEAWKEVAIGTSTLSELELMLGEVAWAVADAEQSVTYADRSGDAEWQSLSCTTHADALYQAGRWAEAEGRFREAENMQAERQPAYPLLYSVQGFQYCDLLLTEAARAAWQYCLSLNSQPPIVNPLESCRAVKHRAAQTLKWEERMYDAPILDIALNHLTMCHAALYAAILGGMVGCHQTAATQRGEDTSYLAAAHRELDAAMASLRRAGTAHYIPRALLTRAWLRSLTGLRTCPESAQSDLDEAWEIAERGPMPLFTADIHLYRARLFGKRKVESRKQKSEKAYPWESPQADLAEARHLIYKHGYLRRKEELEDAEEALLR